VSKLYKQLTYIIAAVWLVNGLFCKVLNLVPRHKQIVGRILGGECAELLTKAIGLAEIGMTIWIISGIKTRLNVFTQIILIAAMNSIEFVLASDLLLWGRANAVFALLFIVVIYINAFHLNPNAARKV